MPEVFSYRLPKNGSLTTEFTEIRDIIRNHRVFYLTFLVIILCSVFCLIIMAFFSVFSVANALLRITFYLQSIHLSMYDLWLIALFWIIISRQTGIPMFFARLFTEQYGGQTFLSGKL